jgi:hypothetical protein
MTFFATGLPKGLSLKPGGIVTGKPTAVGPHLVNLTVVDGRGSRVTTSFIWKVVKPHRLVVAPRPGVAGRLASGSVARVALGVIRRDSASGKVLHPSISVQWYVNGHAVKGATKRTFRIRESFKGKRVSVRVIARMRSYVTYQNMSVAVKVR